MLVIRGLRGRMSRPNRLVLLLLASTLCFATDVTTFHVRIIRPESSKSRLLVDKSGVLTFNDAARRLTFSGGKKTTSK